MDAIKKEPMFENVIYYKCKCNDKIHTIALGESKENKPLDMVTIKKRKCPVCGTVINIQDKERWIIVNNKITKETI